MKCVKVRWFHQNPDYPVMLYSELDSQNWEVRKIEAYVDGRMDFADHEKRSGSTKLSIEPYPPLEDIGADSEFEPSLIAMDEFERVWAEALSFHESSS